MKSRNKGDSTTQAVKAELLPDRNVQKIASSHIISDGKGVKTHPADVFGANFVPINQALRFCDQICFPPLGCGLTLLPESDRHERLQTPTACPFVCCWVCERETTRCVWRAIWLMTSSRCSSGTFFHQRLVSLFQFGAGVDFFHHAIAHPLLTFELAHFIQDDGALQPVAGHTLKVSPMFWVLFDVGVNLGLHFGIDPVGGLVGRRICAGCAIGRCFCCAHNEFGCWLLLLSACLPTKCFTDSTNQALHWSWKWVLPAVALARFRAHRAAVSCRSP